MTCWTNFVVIQTAAALLMISLIYSSGLKPALLSLVGRKPALLASRILRRRIDCFRCLMVEKSRYLDVPFDDKNQVKSLGGRWDPESKKWYIPQGLDMELFQQWVPIYLNVPFEERANVKSLGAKWDANVKKWVITSKKDISQFTKWLNDQDLQQIKTNGSTKSTGSTTAMPMIEPQPKVWSSKTSATSSPASQSKPSMFVGISGIAMLLCVDTNGLPLQTGPRKPTYDELTAYDTSRIVQMSYILCNMNDLQKIESESFIIKKDGFSITNPEFHGVTDAISTQKGIPFTIAAQNLMKAMEKADNLIAHSGDFTFNVLKSELFRYGMINELSKVESCKAWCAMENTKMAVGLLDKNKDPKTPSLKELVAFALQEELPAQRNASLNCEYLRKALQVLLHTDKLQFTVSHR